MTSNRKYALAAGWSLIGMAIAAGYSYGYVLNSFIVEGNPRETQAFIQDGMSDFIGGVVGWMIIFLLDLVVTWALWNYFRRTDAKLSSVTAGLRLVYTTFLGVAIYQLMQVIPLANNLSAANQVMERLGSFDQIWSMGLIIFGFHLMGLGLIALKASNISNVFGYLLLFAGASYVAANAVKVFLPEKVDLLGTMEMILSLPMAVGELAFAVWLIVKVGKQKKLSV